MVILHQLEELGCTAVHCPDGKEAVELFMREPFDAVLMDIQMPVMGGVEACRIMRSQSSATTPIVALTANALEEERELCLSAGMNAFLTKPTTMLQLRDTLFRVVIAQSGSVD